MEVATGWCFGPCQFTAISIDSSRELNFYGGRLVPGRPRNVVKGYYTAKVSEAFWDTVNIKLENIHYKKLDTSYLGSADDRTLEIIIYYQNKLKHINAQSSDLPDGVRNLVYWIANSYQLAKLIPVNGRIKFNTVVQSDK